MHICFCPDTPLNTDAVVRAVGNGCSSMKDIVATTGAGTYCHGCAPTLSKVKPVVPALAAERDATGAGWPSSDQYEKARSAVNAAVLR